MKTLCKLVCRNNKQLSVRRQCVLLGINRSSLYYKSLGENKENLTLMETIDRLYLEDPTLGVIGMQDELREMGMNYNVKRIRRLMRKMGITPIYPKRNLSKLGKAEYVYPYLLMRLKTKNRIKYMKACVVLLTGITIGDIRESKEKDR